MGSDKLGETQALQSFNLATMSGIFPGTRTQIYQRAQVIRVDEEGTAWGWIQIHWYDEPSRCVVYLATPGTDATATTPLFELIVPTLDRILPQLEAGLQAHGWQLTTCGNCVFWQAASHKPSTGNAAMGRCGWTETNQTESQQAVPLPLSNQSSLALRCPHWQVASQLDTGALPAATHEESSVEQMRRSGESAAIRLSWWQRRGQSVKRFLRRVASSSHSLTVSRADKPQSNWMSVLEERSGVGAGTEPCFVCQGRIANLGALTVATPEDDKQTFSLWRCRSCYTLYLNDWIDRWERLDNLETEETYYRIAPAEARELLDLIYQERGGEHPHRRHERTAQRQQFLDFLATRTPLSHQIRQGR